MLQGVWGTYPVDPPEIYALLLETTMENIEERIKKITRGNIERNGKAM